jgi:hypothetical protein
MWQRNPRMNLRHHSLVAWQRADDLFIKLHKRTIQSFPKFERFELGPETLKELNSDANAAGAPLVGLVHSIRREHGENDDSV